VGAQTHGAPRESTLAQHRIDNTVIFDFIAKRPKVCCWRSKNEDAARAKLYAPPVAAADVQRFFRDFRHEFGDDKFNIAHQHMELATDKIGKNVLFFKTKNAYGQI
jgi:hypothetical protein